MVLRNHAFHARPPSNLNPSNYKHGLLKPPILYIINNLVVAHARFNELYIRPELLYFYLLNLVSLALPTIARVFHIASNSNNLEKAREYSNGAMA
jgi:hypothetical protein